MDGYDELRFVLIGKSGHGKSSTGNTILKEEKFPVWSGPNFIRDVPVAEMATIGGRAVKVFDTPGLCSPSEYPDYLELGSAEYLTEVSPGPHAFVLVLKVERFTEPELEMVRKFTTSSFLDYAVILFTHGDNLDKSMTIDDFVRESTELTDLVEHCGDRCHVIDNKSWNQEHAYRSNNVQVENLLNTIKTMAENTGYYSDSVLQRVEGRILREMDKLRNEYDMDAREARNAAKRKILKDLRKKGAFNNGAFITVGLVGAVLIGACLMKSTF